MEKIEAPKKERKFLKAIGNIGKVLAQELVMGIGRKLIGGIVDKIKLPKKRQGLIILLLLSCGIAFAQYPATGNKQRLGFQTTADGLVWRGSLSDTASIQPTSNQNAWVILDTVNFKFYSFDFTSNVWNQLPSGTTIDTTSLSNRINLRVRYADTATMLQNYALKYYVDSIANNFQDSINDITNGYFKQQFTSVTSDTLLWTRSVQLPTDENLLLAFRNGQILNNNQYTRIDTNKIKISANSYKVGENYTIVYVKGGGGSGGGGSSFDTTDLNLQARLDLKLNISDTLNMLSKYLRKADTTNMLLPYFRDSDTTSLNLTSRFNTKLNISDTSGMLSNYATKAYADTSGRFYARQDFTNVISSTLNWTQSDTLVVGGVTVVQVYRNGQILLPSQYTIPTNASVVIGSTAYKAGENYTVIFPRGGGAGSDGGSGSLTSISGGTGITVSPNPITTTGTVSADLNVLMELTDTTLLNLTSRFAAKLNAADTTNMLLPYFRDSDTTSLNLTSRLNTKLNISDTLNMLLPYFRDADTTLLNLTSRFASKLNPADTVSLSNRINAKGSGTVTSVGSGFGLLGGTITTSGTLRLDSATVFNRIRDSIVDIAIGTDTIKILKQEYQPATTNVLTWTVTSKFPIQLKAYILVFRNGQLLNNDQYNLTDTNKITIVSTSFKSGSNYTVATVSGIGSVGTGVYPNPVYPDAGIALSTGSAWASSITNNSANWNTAYSDRLKWDGGSTGLTAATGRTSLGGSTIGQSMFTLSNPSNITFPRFNANNTVEALSASAFRSAIGAGQGTVTSVTAASTAGNPLSITNTTTTPTIDIQVANTSNNGYLTSTDWNTFNGKQSALGFTPANSTININTTAPLQGGGNLTSDKTLSISQASGSANGFLSSTDWTTFNNKQNALTNPVTGTGVSGHIPRFTGTSTLDSSSIYSSNGKIGVGIDVTTSSSHLTSKFVVRDNGNNFKFDGSTTSSGYTTTFSHDNTGLKIGHSSNIRDIRFILNGTSGLTIANNSNSPARAVGIATDSPSHQLDVNGTFRATGAATLGSTLAVTGAITEGGNNVMTNLDTVSLSSRIDNKVGLTGNETVAGNKTLSGNTTLSGTVTMSSTSATPTGLIGINASNVIGDVTTVEQTGIFARGVITNQTTSSGGIVTLTHGLSWTPAIAFANLPGSNTNIVNVALVDATYILFVVRDGATNNVLNDQNVPAIQWFAIK